MKLRLSALTGNELRALRDALGDLPYPITGEAARLIARCEQKLNPVLAPFAPCRKVWSCRWFALCDHVAIGTMTHATLGEVPICERCKNKVDGLTSDLPYPFTPYETKEPTT